ncbi:MAG: GntR family transcriptional regulator [Betaproteobacteria bacterium]
MIRKLIFSRELKPGERIDEQALARDLGISRTPLREALKVLQNEGLVKLVPRRGCFVAKLTERDVEEIYEMVGLLESACAAHAAERATPAEIARLRRITQRMAQTAAEKDYKRYFEANLAAHAVVLEIAGNRWQKSVIEYLRGLCRLWPYVSVGNIPGRLEESLREHQELCAAIEARDAPRAGDVMRRHIAHTLEALRKLAAAEFANEFAK